MRPAIIWGGRGQAKVLRPILEHHGYRLVAMFDRDPATPPPFADMALLGGWEAFERWAAERTEATVFAAAVGGGHGRDRCGIAARLAAAKLLPVTLVHPRAWVAATADLAEGCQILAMSAISEETRLGPHCIVNTGASIDHECRLGAGVHVMPGAVLAGMVEVGDFATIGSNATVLPRIRIGAGAMVGAGAVVTRDVADGVVVVGSPARPYVRKGER